MEKTEISGKKKIAAVVAGVAFILGFLLLDNSMTGNAVLNNQPALNSFSVVGLLLVFCSAILVVYTLKK